MADPTPLEAARELLEARIAQFMPRDGLGAPIMDGFMITLIGDVEDAAKAEAVEPLRQLRDLMLEGSNASRGRAYKLIPVWVQTIDAIIQLAEAGRALSTTEGSERPTETP